MIEESSGQNTKQESCIGHHGGDISKKGTYSSERELKQSSISIVIMHTKGLGGDDEALYAVATGYWTYTGHNLNLRELEQDQVHTTCSWVEVDHVPRPKILCVLYGLVEKLGFDAFIGKIGA